VTWKGSGHGGMEYASGKGYGHATRIVVTFCRVRKRSRTTISWWWHFTSEEGPTLGLVGKRVSVWEAVETTGATDTEYGWHQESSSGRKKPLESITRSVATIDSEKSILPTNASQSRGALAQPLYRLAWTPITLHQKHRVISSETGRCHSPLLSCGRVRASERASGRKVAMWLRSASCF
jgi:hypothetical protein